MGAHADRGLACALRQDRARARHGMCAAATPCARAGLLRVLAVEAACALCALPSCGRDRHQTGHANRSRGREAARCCDTGRRRACSAHTAPTARPPPPPSRERRIACAEWQSARRESRACPDCGGGVASARGACLRACRWRRYSRSERRPPQPRYRRSGRAGCRPLCGRAASPRNIGDPTAAPPRPASTSSLRLPRTAAAAVASSAEQAEGRATPSPADAVATAVPRPAATAARQRAPGWHPPAPPARSASQ